VLFVYGSLEGASGAGRRDRGASVMPVSEISCRGRNGLSPGAET